MKKYLILFLLVVLSFSSCDFWKPFETLVLMDMIPIESATFVMGNEEDYRNPVHTVTLSEYEMSKYEVTNDQYTKFLNDLEVGEDGYYDGVLVFNNNHPIKFDGEKYIVKDVDSVGRASYPVSYVTWHAAIQFCNWLSEKNGLETVYTIDSNVVTADLRVYGFRLPTDAEWEFAARGAYLTNDYTYSGSDSLDNVAWYVDNSNNYRHEVGQKNSNELDISDMSGNVAEWCWDWYDPYYYLNSDPVTDPEGYPTQDYDYQVISDGFTFQRTGTYTNRCLRGGSYKGSELECQVLYRSFEEPETVDSGIGFRVARSARNSR